MEGNCTNITRDVSVCTRPVSLEQSLLDSALPLLDSGMCYSYTKGARTNVLLPFAFLFFPYKSAAECPE